MRRLKISALAIGLLMVAAPPAFAKKKVPPPPPEPACADVLADTLKPAAYRTPQDPTGADLTTANQPNATGAGLLVLSYQLAAPSCSGYTYSLVVFDGDGTAPSGPMSELTRQSQPGDGTRSSLTYAVPVTNDADQYVCIAAVHTDSSGAVVERAPDTGCVVVGPGAGGQGFQ